MKDKTPGAILSNLTEQHTPGIYLSAKIIGVSGVFVNAYGF